MEEYFNGLLKEVDQRMATTAPGMDGKEVIGVCREMVSYLKGKNRELKEYGDFVFGIGGVVTFKKSKLAEAVREMQLRDIVLETDCPYLTPAPYRGQRNESAYVRYVCDKVAEIKGLDPEEVAAATTANARRMFGRPQMPSGSPAREDAPSGHGKTPNDTRP